MEPVFSSDGAEVMVLTEAGQRTIPLARWPLEAEALGLGTWQRDGFIPATPGAGAARFLPISRAALRLGLLQAGITGAQVEKVIDGLPEGMARETALILWQDSHTYHRDHALIASLAAALKLEDRVVDALWRVAEGM